MKKTFLFAPIALFLLSSCNMLGFMDSPSGDAQLIDAARACLNKGDYECALEYYQKVSSAQSDVKTSELSLTDLASNNIFKMSDLFESLGTGSGSSSSLLFLAETIANRGKTSATERLLIRKAYEDSGSISNPTLREYMKFITSMIMANHILASAVGSDGVLSASDIVQNPNACINIGCPGNCNPPAGSLLEDNPSSDPGDMNTDANWDSEPSIGKLIVAMEAADSASTTLFGGGSGTGISAIFGEIIDSLPPGASQCLKRNILLSTLFQ